MAADRLFAHLFAAKDKIKVFNIAANEYWENITDLFSGPNFSVCVIAILARPNRKKEWENLACP